jgi:uncharacterized membrane protein
MRGHRDLTWTCAAAVVCAVVSVLVPIEVVSLIFLLPLALFLTGYAIVAAALPNWMPDASLRATASLGISLSVLALGGLILNYVGGLRAVPWAVLLVLIVIACCRWAAVARPWRGERRLQVRFPGAGVLSVIAVAIGLLAAGGGLALAFHPVAAPGAKGFSELWLNTGTSPTEVDVGIGNQEHKAIGYGVIAQFGGDAKPVVRHVELRPGQRQVLTLPILERAATGPIPVEVTLYREGFPNQPYREVSGWAPRRTDG